MSGITPAPRITLPAVCAPPSRPDQLAEAKSSAPVAAADGLALSGSFYSGVSAGYKVTWSARDLAAAPLKDGAPGGFSLLKVNTDAFNAPPEEGDIGGAGDLEVSAKLRSVVGPYMGFQSTSSGYAEGAAHPWANTTLTTLDMRTGKEVALTDLFSRPALYQAMMQDPLVKQMLGGAKPKDFDTMVAALQDKEDEDGTFIFTKEMYQNFAIHHVEGDKVAVRVAVPYGTELHRGELTQLGLLLPIPAELKAPLAASASRKEGVLWQDLARATRDKQTAIALEKPAPAPAAEESTP